jgi:outer membrane protein, multidrug efflux system
MKKKFIYRTLFIAGCLLFFIFSSCQTLNTNLSTNEKTIPSNYPSNTDSTSIAKMDWRTYFADPLLIKLIDSAIVGNFDLKMALQRIDVSRSMLRFSKGKLFPTIDGNIQVGSTKYAKYTQENAGNSTTMFEGRLVPNPLDNFFVGLSTNWEIDIWGKLKNQRKSSLSNLLASIEGKNFVVSNLVSEIAINYYELIALDNELEIIQQTIQRQQDALEAVKVQKDNGKSNELAVQQFQSQLLNTQASEKETNQIILETENKINFLLGRFPQSIERKKEGLFQNLPLQIKAGVPSQLLTNRPDIREAEFKVMASKFELKAAKAAFFPNINISAQSGFQAFNSAFLFANPASLGYSVLSGLVTPLINRNALKNHFNTAKANQLTAIYNYQKSILNGYVEVSNELSNIQNLQEINRLKKQQNDLLILSVETSNDLYKYGRASYLEVLLAQQNSLKTTLEFINSTKRQRIATVNLYKALGGGWQ